MSLPPITVTLDRRDAPAGTLEHPVDVQRYQERCGRETHPKSTNLCGVPTTVGLGVNRADTPAIAFAPFRLDIVAIDVYHGHYDTEVRLDCSVADRDTGSEARIIAQKCFPPHTPPHWAVRQLVAEFLIHELDECLRYADGTHIHDPHLSQLPCHTEGI